MALMNGSMDALIPPLNHLVTFISLSLHLLSVCLSVSSLFCLTVCNILLLTEKNQQ